MPKVRKSLIGTRLDVSVNLLWTNVALLLGGAKVQLLKFLMEKTRKCQIHAHVVIKRVRFL